MNKKLSVESFETFDREMCLKLWETQFGSAPPKFTSVGFMRKALVYEAQAAAFGGHPRAVRNVLRACLRAPLQGNGTALADQLPSPAALRAGTHLVREWNGRKYQVEVMFDGFQMDGKHYRSLSGIAREITGTGWSGPRFFALARA